MTTECKCLRSVYDNGVKQYYCIDHECYKSEAERLECIVTKTFTEECAFLEDGKCTIDIDEDECLQIGTKWRCPKYETKQSNWRELERAEDSHNYGRPIDSVYSKPHIIGIVLGFKPPKITADGLYELTFTLHTKESITRYFSSGGAMDEFRKEAKWQYIWLEDDKLTIIDEISPTMATEAKRVLTEYQASLAKQYNQYHILRR